MNLKVLPDRKFMTALVIDFAIIALTFWVAGAVNNLFVYALAVFIIGSRQHALAILGHEAAHNLVSKNRKINDWLTTVLCGFPVFLSLDGYRKWHLAHHKYLGTDKDTELVYRENPAYKLPASKLILLKRFLLDLIGLGVNELFQFLYTIRPATKIYWLGPIITAACFITIAFYTNTLFIPIIWYISLITSFWACYRIRTWYEHIGVESKGRLSSHRYHAGPLIQFLFFPHNVWLHYEHHKFPNVPFYDLPKLREIDESEPILTMGEVLDRFANYPSVKEEQSKTALSLVKSQPSNDPC